MLQTLVLNMARTPISIVPYRKVLTRVRNNAAVVLKSYENTCIRSAGGFTLPIPSVIQCVNTNYIPKFTKTLPFNRMNVYIRDFGHCMYCGKKVGLNSFSFDHYVARSMGGKTCWTNILLCCMKCNAKKGNKPASKFTEPIRMPYAPQLDKAAPVHLVNKIAAEIPHETWTDYLYWNIQLES
jgi:5-methylcytosine-specific restriction endonuclease McrA